MESAYLVRYGAMSRIGPFFAEGDTFSRGQRVVVSSRRGSELGEILLQIPNTGISPSPAKILRTAGPDDFRRAREVQLERPARLAACERVFRDGIWPLELVDVEPLLDGSRTVLHYLGPHHLDSHGLRALFRDACGLDIVLEPAGLDAPDDLDAEPEPEHACGSCGSTSGGGCGQGHGDASGGCAGCSVASLVKGRRPIAQNS